MKMNIRQKFMALIVFVAVASISFVGCNKDDFDGPNIKNPENRPVQAKEVKELNEIFKAQFQQITEQLIQLQKEWNAYKNESPRTRYTPPATFADLAEVHAAISQMSTEYNAYLSLITANSNSAAANSSNINTNTTNIATNRTDIDGNRTDIDGNRTDIDGNRTDINANTMNIATNRTDIDGNRTDIDGNRTDIDGNRTDINANTMNIAKNRTDIDKNKARLDALEPQLTAIQTAQQDLETAIHNGLGASDNTGVQDTLKAMHDRYVKLTDEYIKNLLQVSFDNIKVHEENLDAVDWSAVIRNQWATNNGNTGKLPIEELIDLQVKIDNLNTTLRDFLTQLKKDMYGDGSEDPGVGGVWATTNWLYFYYNQEFIDAMKRDLGLTLDDGNMNPVAIDHKFNKIVDVFEQLKVKQKKDGKYSSLLLEAFLADFGEVVEGSGSPSLKKWQEYKNYLKGIIEGYRAQPEFAFVVPSDNIWENLEWLHIISSFTDLMAYRTWFGLDMDIAEDYDPVTLQPMGPKDPDANGIVPYESKKVTANWLEIQRLKKKVDMQIENIQKVYNTVGNWVTDLEFIPNYVNDKKVPYVPFRYIRDEQNTVSGYFNLVYNVSPSNAWEKGEYTVESVDIVATPQTRSAAGAIHVVDSEKLYKESLLRVKVYVENIEALEGKNVGFVLKVRNNNANLKKYNEKNNSYDPVTDPTQRIYQSAIVYGEVTENEVGIASRKSEIDIDQRFVVRKVGESDADALARAKASDSYVEFVSTDNYSFDLAERLLAYVYDSKQEISLIELSTSPEQFSNEYRKEQFIDYKLEKAELLKGEDGKYLQLDGTVLKRRPIVGGADLSFGKFQYVKLTYTFNGYDATFDKEGSVTRVAYIKLKMTNPAVTAVKEFSFTTEYQAGYAITEYYLADDVDFYTAIGFNRAQFKAIYGRPVVTNDDNNSNNYLEFSYYDIDNQPLVSYGYATPVGSYKGVYTYKAEGYPDVVMTWNVNIVLPELKVAQTAVELEIDETAPNWQYQPFSSLFVQDPKTGDINFNGDTDDYFFRITRLPSGFRIDEAGGQKYILRSNAEVGSYQDRAAIITGKQIILDGGAKAEFWQSVRRIGGMQAELVAVRGAHKTVVAKNIRINFSERMYFSPEVGTGHINNRQTSVTITTPHFATIDTEWVKSSKLNGWFGVTTPPQFTGEAYVKNSAGEYDELPKRYMDQLTINKAGNSLTWKGKTVEIPTEGLVIYLPVQVEHSYGTYSEMFILTVTDN